MTPARGGRLSFISRRVGLSRPIHYIHTRNGQRTCPRLRDAASGSDLTQPRDLRFGHHCTYRALQRVANVIACKLGRRTIARWKQDSPNPFHRMFGLPCIIVQKVNCDAKLVNFRRISFFSGYCMLELGIYGADFWLALGRQYSDWENMPDKRKAVMCYDCQVFAFSPLLQCFR